MASIDKKTGLEIRKHTSAQLDATVTTLIAILLTGFIVGQRYVADENEQLLVGGSVFALLTLLLHFISFITAHYSQSLKVNHHNIHTWLNRVTVAINITVQSMTVMLFVFVIYLVIRG